MALAIIGHQMQLMRPPFCQVIWAPEVMDGYVAASKTHDQKTDSQFFYWVTLVFCFF